MFSLLYLYQRSFGAQSCTRDRQPHSGCFHFAKNVGDKRWFPMLGTMLELPCFSRMATQQNVPTTGPSLCCASGTKCSRPYFWIGCVTLVLRDDSGRLNLVSEATGARPTHYCWQGGPSNKHGQSKEVLLFSWPSIGRRPSTQYVPHPYAKHCAGLGCLLNLSR